MPKRTDIKSILIVGAGPIVIGQACEFDYSGVQACKALKQEGYRVILVNSNPATIMTDPDMADSIYIEPSIWQTIAEIIEKERPDALLPTMGGQTALNCALDLDREGVLDKFSVAMIGANTATIDMAEDRELFRKAMDEIGLQSANSVLAHSLEEAIQQQPRLGFPTIIRPSFTLGGSGGGIAYNLEEFRAIVEHGLDLSPTSEILLEESLLGWKEFEMEVVRDQNDNCIIICSIENFDPMGVHTGDSITVAPAQTLTDKEYQIMRNASIEVLRKIGVDTGGSNVQFAVNPEDGRLVIIEMNPRVSRSSALASKATGFPIAKVAAKLAVGYTLDELQNEITGGATPASFEPSIDYVVTKIPRFTFEKFPQAKAKLSTQMKSVGEVMAIGRTFQESFQKALRGLEIGVDGLDPMYAEYDDEHRVLLESELQEPGPHRVWFIGDALRNDYSIDELYALSAIDPWFLAQLKQLIDIEVKLSAQQLDNFDQASMRDVKRRGFSDRRLAKLLQCGEEDVRNARYSLNAHPIYKRVDTCAAEFATSTAYMYSSYDEECEAQPTKNKKIIVLGGGPNRIGQGIEFDYCCVHAAFALHEDGYETIMVNCNPETVSTDYDTSDRLYFEPLTLEDVLEIVRVEQPHGVIVQFGGQTPLKLARDLEAAGVPIIGTSPDSIDLAEDRERFLQLVKQLDLLQPPNATATSTEQAIAAAEEIGYPVVVRPSYVLGGRAMEIVYNQSDLKRYMREAVKASNDAPVLIDHFLADAVEVDLDAICDGKDVLIGGIMQHIEQAGIHSGDSACSLPPYNLSDAVQEEMRAQARKLALALNVIGLMNIQFAIKGEKVYLIEVNPRASRTVPFVSKAIGVPLAKIAARCMVGSSLKEQKALAERIPEYYSVKEAVFPFIKFSGVDPILGPEMKSTGEVMGVGKTFGEAFGKSQFAAGILLPEAGSVLLSVRNEDKQQAVQIARHLQELGFSLVATKGTAKSLHEKGLECRAVNKVREGRPHIVDMIIDGKIDLIVNTTEGKQAIADSFTIRREALQHKVCYTTTIAGAWALKEAMQSRDEYKVYRLQDLHAASAH